MLVATVAYAALSVALTWPLARGLTRDLPGDFGDPLLNCWILAWDADHLLRALGGHVTALGNYWNANIYHPHPLALAYSDHLTAQAIQILPLYAISRNPLLCYNVLLLSTFVLSGVGMFVLARDLTGDRAAAFVAGLAFAFAPYRVGSIPHVQVLSSAWMPFTLLGFRRFFDTRRTGPLAGACAAWVAQNLSCGYYLIFFSPIVALYLAWELTTRRLWTDARTLARVAAAVAAVVLATTPFVLPYVRLRHMGFGPRSLEETEHFSADVYAYLTADPNLWVWGRVFHAWPRAENALFPGLTIVVLAAIAIAASWRHARSAAHRYTLLERGGTYKSIVAWALGLSAAVLVAILLGWTLRLPVLRITRFDRVLFIVTTLSIVLLAVSLRARATAREWVATPVGMLTLLTLFAAAMSFGPHIHSRGKLIEEENIYAAFYNFVPGFDGLRVPARFGMIVALGLAALAGYGARLTSGLRRRRGLLVAAGLSIVIESSAIPLGINGNSTDYKQSGLAPLPPYVATGSATPPVYGFVAQLPPGAALLELPFGEVAFEVRYMFYSTTHWRPLANGYSGGGPDEYGLLAESVKDLFSRPEPAWAALVASGATHAIVHEASYADGRGRQVTDWLSRHGAREIAVFGADHVFAIDPRFSTANHVSGQPSGHDHYAFGFPLAAELATISPGSSGDVTEDRALVEVREETSVLRPPMMTPKATLARSYIRSATEVRRAYCDFLNSRPSDRSEPVLAPESVTGALGAPSSGILLAFTSRNRPMDTTIRMARLRDRNGHGMSEPITCREKSCIELIRCPCSVAHTGESCEPHSALRLRRPSWHPIASNARSPIHRVPRH